MSIISTQKLELGSDVISRDTLDRDPLDQQGGHSSRTKLIGSIALAIVLVWVCFSSQNSFGGIVANESNWIPFGTLLLVPVLAIRLRQTMRSTEADKQTKTSSWWNWVSYLFLAVGAFVALRGNFSVDVVYPLLALVFVWFSHVTLHFGRYGWAQSIAVGLFILLPALFQSSLWESLQVKIRDCIAWESSGMLDGIVMPHLRSSLVIQLVDRTVDVTSFATNHWGLEALLSVTVLYVLFRRSSFLVMGIVLFTLLPVWTGLLSLSMLVHIRAIVSDFQIHLTPIQWSASVFAICSIFIVASEYGWRHLMAPIPYHSFASEFPLFAMLYNRVSSFPPFSVAMEIEGRGDLTESQSVVYDG